jgi:predicted acyltransferase
MVLMIFVNDLWSLKEIPAWLGHVESGVDGIGLADVVFPAFLFIVGLSLPYAINNRRKKGDKDWQLVKHGLFRTLALLIMGVFLVNGESINEDATGMPRLVWNSVGCLCFILIWNSYPKTSNKILTYGLKTVGIVTLLVFAFIYRGGPENDLYYFSPHWWGILGLIGWAYLASGLITIFARNNFYVILSAWIFFAVLSMISKAGLLPDLFSVIPSAISGGTLAGLTMGGVVTSMIFQYYTARNNNNNNNNVKLTIVFISISLFLIILSVLARPYWGLAKLGATPAWLFLCSAFTILAFVAIYWLTDVYKKGRLFHIIKPAGTDTLLCYLIPYFAYATTRLLGIHLPEIILVGSVGLVKSFLFALLCAVITGWLIKAGVRLKL